MSEHINAWIKARRELHAVATEGLWEAGETQHFHDGSFHASYAEVEPGVAAGCSPEDAAAIADARTTLPAALNALGAVLALHAETTWCPTEKAHGCTVCADVEAVCDADSESWPCPTVRAIAEALGVEP